MVVPTDSNQREDQQGKVARTSQLHTGANIPPVAMLEEVEHIGHGSWTVKPRTGATSAVCILSNSSDSDSGHVHTVNRLHSTAGLAELCAV